MATATASRSASPPAPVASAAVAQERWASLAPAGRARVLDAAARAVRVHADAVVDTIVAETAKPRTEAIAHELYAACDHARWLARHAPRVLAPERVRPPLHLAAKRARIVYEPLGVVAAITPWNLPFGIPFVQAVAALAAGNGVVLKPSELTPRSAEWVPRLLEEAGAPRGLVGLAHGGVEAGEALVADPAIAKVFFTGSVAAGRRVAAAAGGRGCPVALELGGHDALVVFADAELERAVEGALFAAFLNSGQACVSAERILVERPVHDRFVEQLEERARRLELAPLVSESPHEAVATVVRGPLPDEEIFGPVVAVEPFDDEDEAVARANESAFGLGASVWTRDLAKARRVAHRLRAGMVWTNDVGYSFTVGAAPWGGEKASGFGRTGSKHGLYERVRIRFVDADAGRFRPPWWFPYEPETEAALRVGLDVLYADGLERVRSAWRHRAALRRLARRVRR